MSSTKTFSLLCSDLSLSSGGNPSESGGMKENRLSLQMKCEDRDEGWILTVLSLNILIDLLLVARHCDRL